MMTPTSEERREVAARLRNLAGHIAADEELTLDALGLYRGENVEGYDTYGVMHLADLIDPTCHADVNKHGRAYCTNCGCDDWCLADGSPFCPNCGARVVSSDE